MNVTEIQSTGYNYEVGASVQYTTESPKFKKHRLKYFFFKERRDFPVYLKPRITYLWNPLFV